MSRGRTDPWQLEAARLEQQIGPFQRQAGLVLPFSNCPETSASGRF